LFDYLTKLIKSGLCLELSLSSLGCANMNANEFFEPEMSELLELILKGKEQRSQDYMLKQNWT